MQTRKAKPSHGILFELFWDWFEKWMGSKKGRQSIFKKGQIFWGNFQNSAYSGYLPKNMVVVMCGTSKFLLLKSKYNITRGKIWLFNLEIESLY